MWENTCAHAHSHARAHAHTHTHARTHTHTHLKTQLGVFSRLKLVLELLQLHALLLHLNLKRSLGLLQIVEVLASITSRFQLSAKLLRKLLLGALGFGQLLVHFLELTCQRHHLGGVLTGLLLGGVALFGDASGLTSLFAERLRERMEETERGIYTRQETLKTVAS